MMQILQPTSQVAPSFLMVPDYVLTNEALSSDAILLYARILRRGFISQTNTEYQDADGVFVYYSISDVQEHFHCSTHKACALFKELEAASLIIRKKRGQGTVSKIYPLVDMSNTENQDLQKMQLSYNNNSSISYNQPTYISSIKSINTHDRTEEKRSQIEYILRDMIPFYQTYHGQGIWIHVNKKHKRFLSATEIRFLMQHITEDLINTIIVDIHEQTNQIPNKTFITSALFQHLLKTHPCDNLVKQIKKQCNYSLSLEEYPELHSELDYIVQCLESVMLLSPDTIIQVFGISTYAKEYQQDLKHYNYNHFIQDALYVKKYGIWEGMEDNSFIPDYKPMVTSQDIKKMVEYDTLITTYTVDACDTMVYSLNYLFNLDKHQPLKVCGSRFLAGDIQYLCQKINYNIAFEALSRFTSLQHVVIHPVSYFLSVLVNIAAEYDSRFSTIIHSGQAGIDFCRTA